jgi:hypothetical protein
MRFNFDLRPILVTALSLSIGWGIRGNFGHEFGAMIPGALAAMAAVLLSNREDYHINIFFSECTLKSHTDAQTGRFALRSFERIQGSYHSKMMHPAAGTVSDTAKPFLASMLAFVPICAASVE